MYIVVLKVLDQSLWIKQHSFRLVFLYIMAIAVIGSCITVTYITTIETWECNEIKKWNKTPVKFVNVTLQEKKSFV